MMMGYTLITFKFPSVEGNFVEWMENLLKKFQEETGSHIDMTNGEGTIRMPEMPTLKIALEDGDDTEYGNTVTIGRSGMDHDYATYHAVGELQKFFSANGIMHSIHP